MLAAFGSLDMTAAHATRGGSGAPRLLGALLHPPRRTVNLRHLALFAWRTIPPTCPRQTSNLKRPRGVLDARPAITACDTPCAVAATARCSVDSSAAHFAEETGWSSYVTDGGLTGAPSWPFWLYVASSPGLVGRWLAGPTCMLHDAWYLLEVRAPDSLRIARRVLHEALVGWGVRPSVFCRLCV